ncbi:MAG: TonB-dependent siderophore receptor [Bryobacteraceae bacterium]|nr:TonB-dependent siderophore receptor [Bryobacteraceae bacterium]
MKASFLNQMRANELFKIVGTSSCGVLLAILVAASAQKSFAEPLDPALTGVVTDATGSPVEGARLTAGTDGKSSAYATVSGPGGRFFLPMKPGSYTLRISAEGFQESRRSVNSADLGGAAVAVVLQVASHSEVLTVSDTVSAPTVASSALRVPTALVDVPQAVSIITGQVIRDQAMLSMADVVRYVPGITMAAGEGHRDAPVIRGNATTSDFYVNGVRDDVQYYRDLYNVERVEAVKGANALTFGRGGGGGVINRVSKDASFLPSQEIRIQGGSFGNKRISSDLGYGFGQRVAVRLNTMYENSDSFRRHWNVERYGIAPAVSIRVTETTQVRLNYERFHDGRTVDRGIPSFAGLPAPADRRTFFGDPDDSHASAGVHVGSAVVEHQFSRFNLRNSTVTGDYDKFYKNVLPGAVNASLTQVSLTGYNNLTLRRNLFNQTDLTGIVQTGMLRHTVLIGSEVGRQRSINYRQTAYFGNATTLSVPFASPAVPDSGVSFRQAATDADNQAVNHVGAVFVQDQIELSRFIQVVAGFRYDYFSIDFLNHRNSERLGRQDHMVSPRAGLILKPRANVSVYGSYSVSYLPSSGDQFSSLTATQQTLRPERFRNYETGVKWDASRNLSFTAALYRLDRTNTTARDPNDPARIVQTGSQRSNGAEIGINGSVTRRWLVVGGYAWQDASVSSATTAAAQGARVALVPRHSVSLWNNYKVTSRLGAGLGVVQQGSLFTGIDNTVRLPSFTRVDTAVFYSVTENIRLQANMENLTDRRYYPTAHSNNNIIPGSPRVLKVGLTARF